MSIYGMSEEQIKNHFIDSNGISYGGMIEKAVLHCIEERICYGDSWNELADMLDTLETFIREYGYIETEVSKVYEKLNNKNIKK